MKRKKLLKRIVESRPSKKTDKKVLKRNAKFLYGLCTMDDDVETIERPERVSEFEATINSTDATVMTKANVIGEVKKLIDGACTDMDEKLVTAKPLDSVDIYLIRLQFNKAENPYDIITSPDVNLDAIKNIQACCVLNTKVDNTTEEG